MKNEETKEYEFTKCFVEEYKSKNKLAFIPSASNQSTYADCEIIYDKEHIKFEAKMFNFTNSNSGEFYKMLGELITLRNKTQYIKNPTCDEVLGILIPNTSEQTFLKLWKNLDANDARKYCLMFDLKYLVLFDFNKKNYSFKSYSYDNNCWV